MKLIENECSEALTRLLRPYYAKVDVQNVYHSINKGHSIEDDSNLLTLLIVEYFDNPPLKFEELIKHKVVWDNEIKEFAFVLEQYKPTILNVPAPSDLRAISLEYRGGEIECLLSEKVEETINDYYSPNRFYRKEVQE